MTYPDVASVNGWIWASPTSAMSISQAAARWMKGDARSGCHFDRREPGVGRRILRAHDGGGSPGGLCGARGGKGEGGGP